MNKDNPNTYVIWKGQHEGYNFRVLSEKFTSVKKNLRNLKVERRSSDRLGRARWNDCDDDTANIIIRIAAQDLFTMIVEDRKPEFDSKKCEQCECMFVSFYNEDTCHDCQSNGS